MATTVELQARLEALNEAIATGVRSVTISGQTTIYNTTDSLIRARDDLLAQIATQTAREESATVRKQTYLHYAGRGY